MQTRSIKSLFVGLTALLLTVATARAEGCLGIRPPVRDWTVQVGGRHYGLMGYGSTTSVVLGQLTFRIPMHIYGVTGIVALTLCSLGSLGVRGISKRKHDSHTA